MKWLQCNDIYFKIHSQQQHSQLLKPCQFHAADKFVSQTLKEAGKIIEAKKLKCNQATSKRMAQEIIGYLLSYMRVFHLVHSMLASSKGFSDQCNFGASY